MSSRYLVPAIVALGAALRLWNFASIGLSHFDEGQYAFARVWPWIDRFDADQAFFSPPLYPFLVGLVHWIVGAPWPLSGPLLSCLFSVATIALAYIVARSWRGDEAGLVAAILCAIDPMQIAFARTGTTDATFAFLFLLSMHLCRKAFSSSSSMWTIAAGLACGSTWSCKYNGFLTLVVALAFLPRFDVRSLARWAVVSAVAALPIGAWMLAFHQHHPVGISALIAHQRGYSRGFVAVPSGWLRAIEMWFAISSPFRALPGIVATGVLGAFLAAGSRSGGIRLGWVALVLLTIPATYTPYLRLWLPTETLGVVAAGVGIANLLRRRGWGWMPFLALGPLALMLLFRDVPNLRGGVRGYRDVDGPLADGCRIAGVTRLIAVARPPLFLYAAGRSSVPPIIRANPDSFAFSQLQPGDALLVDRAAVDSPKFGSLVEASLRTGELAEIFRVHIEPTLVTGLDDFPPRAMPTDRSPWDLRIMIGRPTR